MLTNSSFLNRLRLIEQAPSRDCASGLALYVERSLEADVLYPVQDLGEVALGKAERVSKVAKLDPLSAQMCFQLLHAHCSSLFAKKGQEVTFAICDNHMGANWC